LFCRLEKTSKDVIIAKTNLRHAANRWRSIKSKKSAWAIVLGELL
jgi:hypothetical protein